MLYSRYPSTSKYKIKLDLYTVVEGTELSAINWGRWTYNDYDDSYTSNKVTISVKILFWRTMMLETRLSPPYSGPELSQRRVRFHNSSRGTANFPNSYLKYTSGEVQNLNFIAKTLLCYGDHLT